VLKNGFILLMHLIFSFVFYLQWLETEISANVSKSIFNYLNENTFDTAYKLEEI
jgi:hypothetical protein